MATWFSGVASGSATTTSGIFWTRAQNSASDNTGVATDLILELSDTADFKVIAFSKAATTTASNDYTIKTDLSGLKAGTSYFYRYRTTDSSSISDVGQFKTAPLASSVGSVTFGHSGDVDGLIAPYLSTQDLYKQKLDFFIFNGDTIYETASTGSAATLATKSVGTDPAKAAILLADYRRKYLETHQGVPLNGTPGTYQSLDNFFSAQGLYVALDNHELGNKDIINGGAPLSLSTAGFNGSTNPNDDVNLTGAYIHDSLAFKILEQAYLEYQPIRTITVVAPSDPRSNGTTQLYGSQQWGKNVVEINLDTRTYRDVRLNKIDPVTSARSDDTGSRADNPDRTLLGKTQLAWLKQTLLDAKNNGIVWKFINTSDPIDQIGAVGSGDDGGKSWMGGYRAERNDLLKFIADNGITNVMFLSSDDHQGRINEVLYVADPTKPTVYSKVPGVISMVDGPIGATGPDTVTDHTFANIKTLADALAAKQISNGVDPIGLDSNYLGLFNVWREGDPTASAKPSPVDFYSPDTFNYAKLEVTAEGVLNVALRGVDSYAQNSFPTPTDSNQPRDILRFSIDGLASQRTTAMDNNQAMLKPVVGNPYSVKPFFTFGTNPEYSLVGVPDGEGAYRIDSNTIRVLVNAEIGKAVGAAYTLDNGTRLIGARINFLDLNNAGQIKSGGVAYTKVVDRFGQTVTDPAQISGDAGLINGFTRFCSANLFEKDTFGAGKGFADRIFLMGEEDGNVAKGLGGSMCALDVDKGVLYQLGDLPYGSWEGATLVDTGDTSKVAIFLGDDATPSFPMLYVGNKSTDPKASFLERNGLTGGKVYVWAAKDGAAKDRPTEIFGTGTTVAGSWVELAIKDPSKASNDPATGFDKAGYLGTKKIHDAALALNAFACARIEDEDYNHASGKGNQVIFNATGQTSNGEYLDKYGTTYTLDTTFTNGLPGVATLKVVYDGDDAANRQNGIRSQDNIAWSADGYAYINEDRAVSSDADWGPQEGSVWKLDPTTGLATRILQIDRSAIPAGMTDSLKVVDGKNLGEWETSGVIDVSNLYGHAAGTDFFTDVQAHGLKDGPIATNNLVEGGQIIKFEVKDSTRRVDYTKVDNAVITPQFINVEDQLAGHVLYNRLPTAPTANNQPKGLQIGQTQIDFSLALDGSSTGNRARAFTDLAPLLDGLTPAAKRLAYFTFNTPYAAGIAPATPTAFTYDPTGKAGALFYDLDDNGTADKVGLMFVDGGNGDQDGKKNGVVAQSSTAGLASLNPIFAAANTVLKVADPTDPTSPGAVVIHASLGSRASTVNQIGYVALNGSESEAITFDLLKQRGTLLFATLEDSGVPDLSKMKFEEDIHLLNGQKLVFFEVVGNTLDKLLNKGSLDASFQILDVNKAGDSSATASKGSLSIKLNLGGDSSGLDALISNQMGGEATLLDFRGLVGQAIQGDVLVAREAAYTDTIRFYKVESSDGAVVDRLTNLRLLPGQPGYKEAALRSENLFTGFGPLSTDDLVNKSYQINPFKDAGLLAPYATVAETGETLFAFAQQNSDKLNHFRALGSGALGLEDLSAGNGKVDGDFDDVITYFNFSLSPAPVLA